jgi:hypothetical protein
MTAYTYRIVNLILHFLNHVIIIKTKALPEITFIRYAQRQNIWNPNNFKIVPSKKTKGPKDNSQMG